MINININNLRNNIAKAINESDLPMGVVLYVLKDILEEVKTEANRQLISEIAAEKETKEKAYRMARPDNQRIDRLNHRHNTYHNR